MRPERGCSDGPHRFEVQQMPKGLLNVLIIGAIGFFLGAALVGWVYG